MFVHQLMVAQSIAAAGGNVATGPGAPGTFATYDPANTGASILLSGSNSIATAVASPYMGSRSTVAMVSGKWYFEWLIQEVNAMYLGVCTAAASMTSFPATADIVSYAFNGYVADNLGGATLATSPTNGSRVSMAVDLGARTAQYRLNNVAVGPVISVPAGNLYAYMYGNAATPNTQIDQKYGSLTYSPPSGYTSGLYNT